MFSWQEGECGAMEGERERGIDNERERYAQIKKREGQQN